MRRIWQRFYDRLIGPIIHRLNESKRTRITVLIFLVAIIALSGMRVPTYEQKGFLQMALSRSDFEDYLRAAKKLAHSEDPYRLNQLDELKSGEWDIKDLFDPGRLKGVMDHLSGVGTYLYPPLLAFLLIPFVELSYFSAALIFQTLSAITFVFFYIYIYSLYKTRKPEKATTLAAILATVILGSFLTGNATNGNIGFFLLLMMTMGLVLSWSGEVLKDLLGGFLIGLASVLKITPGFLGLVLLGGRRYTAIGGAILGGVFGLLLPAVGFGWGGNLDHLGNWKELILDNYSKKVIVRPWANNQTVSGLAGKFFLYGSDNKQSKFDLPLYAGDGPKDRSHQSIVTNGVRVVNYSLMLLLTVIAFFLAYKKRLPGQGKNPLDDPGFSRLVFATIAISLVVSGVSWYHAYGVLLIPIFFRLRAHFDSSAPLLRFEKNWYIVISFFGIFQSALSSYMRDMLAMYSLFVFVVIGSAVHHLISLTREERSQDGI